MGKAKAIGNVGIGKLEAEAKYSHSTEYTKRSIGAGLGKTTKTRDELQKANRGRKVHYFELSGKLETLGESLSGEAKLKITVLAGDPTAPVGSVDRESKLLSAELELEVQVIAAFGKDYDKSIGIMAKYIAPLAAAITKFVDTARNSISSDDPAKRSGSSIAGVAGDLAFPLSEIENGNELAKGVIESAGKDWEDKVMGTKNPLFEHKAALALGVKLGVARDKPEKPLAFLWEIALLEVKASKIDSGVFKAEFETKQRLGRIGSEGVGGLGFGKM
jgi:hypothetical protein